VSAAREVFRNTAVLAGARVVERVTGLLLALIVARHLGAAGLGVYAAAIAYFGLIQQAGEAGSTNLLVRELAKDRSRTPSYVSHTSVMALGVSGVAMTVALLVIPHLGYSADLRHSLQLIVLAVAPGTLNTIQEAVFVAHGRVEFETLTTLVSSIILVVLSLVLVAHGHGVVTLVLIFVCVEYAVTAVYFVLINRYIARLRFEFKVSIAREIIRDMKAIAGSSLVAGVFARPEIVILSLFATEAQVGYYSGAAKLVDVFQFLPQVYMANVFPLLSRSFHERDGRAQQIQDMVTKHLLAVALPVSVGLFVAADRIISLFYGEDFGNGVTVLRILAINVVLFSLHAVRWRVLAARGEPGRVFRVTLASTSVRVAGGTVLIALFKAIGAAVTVPMSLLVHVLLLGRAVRSDGTPLPLVSLGARFTVAAAAMGGVAYVLDRTTSLWVVVVVGAIVYFALVAALRAFSTEEIALLKSLLPSNRSLAGGSS
jgi:O-antigen/teichoic acid export membrane protein